MNTTHLPEPYTWPQLVAKYRKSRGTRVGAVAIGPETLRIELLMRLLPPDERQQVLNIAGVSETTWWNMCSRPRKVPAPVVLHVLHRAPSIWGIHIDGLSVYEPLGADAAE